MLIEQRKKYCSCKLAKYFYFSIINNIKKKTHNIKHVILIISDYSAEPQRNDYSFFSSLKQNQKYHPSLNTSAPFQITDFTTELSAKIYMKTECFEGKKIRFDSIRLAEQNRFSDSLALSTHHATPFTETPDPDACAKQTHARNNTFTLNMFINAIMNARLDSFHTNHFRCPHYSSKGLLH